MQFDLSSIIRDKTDEQIPIELEMSQISVNDVIYPIAEKKPLDLFLSCKDGRKLVIRTTTEVEFDIPCDRCLTDVHYVIPVEVDFELAIEDGKLMNASDEGVVNFVEGNCLDIDQMIRDELLLNWPTKVLCKEDCKGLCPICGQNLNQQECGCNRVSLDPRMAKFLDVFNQFKEV